MWEKTRKSLKPVAAKLMSVGPLNNIHNELNPDNANSFHKNNVAWLINIPSTLLSGNAHRMDLFVMVLIFHIPHEGTEGNVHTGAPPPWLSQGNLLDSTWRSELSNLISPKAGKSSRLNPKRVGATWAERRKLELELKKRGEPLTNTFSAYWLPNFGRVWQSGTRKDSRKELWMENKFSYKEDVQSQNLLLQPYISKKMGYRYQGANPIDSICCWLNSFTVCCLSILHKETQVNDSFDYRHTWCFYTDSISCTVPTNFGQAEDIGMNCARTPS